MRANGILVVSLVGLALAGLGGCNKEKAQQAARQAASRASQEFEESKLLARAAELLRAVDARDLKGLKRLCGDPDCADYEAIMTCYYNAFVIENDQGVEAARGFLAGEMAKAGAAPVRDKAVKLLNGYFQAKGSLCTREVAGLILIAALEAKYPHRGGRVGKLLAEKLGLTAPTRPATQPAQNPAA